MGPEADTLRLRKALRDLVALSIVPAAWVGREPPAIAAGLADVHRSLLLYGSIEQMMVQQTTPETLSQ